MHSSTGDSFATCPETLHSIRLAFDGVSVMRGRKTVLDGARGIVKGGRLTAVVSACGGSGDFYLLNVLAGHEEGHGPVIANGSPVSSDVYKSSAVIIDEDLTALGRLTVKQNLLYGSEMRIASSRSDHRARLDTVIEWMHLEKHADRQVHACSLYVKRRVSIARELMLHPCAVFVDSAVEGLATHEARELLGLLRNVAQCTGCVLVIAMLQPRWTLLEIVDDVICIEGTRVAFAGTSTELLGVAASGTNVNTSPGMDAPEATINALYRVATNPHGSLEAALPRIEEFQKRLHSDVTAVMGQFTETQLPVLTVPFPRAAPSVLWKALYLYKYNCLEVKNRLWTYVASTALILLVAILVGVVYQRQDENGQTGMQNRLGIIFFVISSTFVHSLLFVDSSKRGYVSYQRHKAHGYFNAPTYLWFWATTNAMQRLVGCIAFMAVVYGLAHVRATVDLTSLQTLVAIMAMTSFATCSVVWVVCCVVPTTRIAHFVLFAVYAFNVVLAGLVLNLNTLPRPFQIASYASLMRLGYESAVISEFEGRSFGCHHTVTGAPAPTVGMDLDGVATTTMAPAGHHYCFTGDSYMGFLGFHSGRLWLNMAVMAYITVGVLIVSLVAMWLGKAR